MPSTFIHKYFPPGFRVFLLLTGLSLLLRFFSFFPSVLDHDESTYLEIARQMLAGKTLYVDYIDIKPPGIFLILAAFQFFFGYSIFVMRLLVAVWVALTAFMVFKTAGRLVNNHKAALASGLIYVFFISTWSYYGVSITPEIFFNLFTIVALYLLLRLRGQKKFLLAGLAAGMGFLVKYFVLADFLAFLVFVLFLLNRGTRPKYPYAAAISLILAAAGFMLPFGLANLWYYVQGNFEAFREIIYLAPSRYPAEFSPLKTLEFIIDFHAMFLPVFFFFYYALFDRSLQDDQLSAIRHLLWAWAPLALAAVILSGRSFGHYTIQLMLPVSLVAGMFFHSERKLPVFLTKATSRRSGLIILAALVVLITLLKLEYVIRKDQPREVAAYLGPRLQADEAFYTGNYHHILYYLLKKDSPTPYLHRSLLMNDHHLEALGIDRNKAFREIMDQRPVYIIVQKEYPPGAMRDFIRDHYFLEMEFDKNILLYRLK